MKASTIGGFHHLGRWFISQLIAIVLAYDPFTLFKIKMVNKLPISMCCLATMTAFVSK